MSLLNLIPEPPGKNYGDRDPVQGRESAQYSKSRCGKVRGKEISMIFQDPMTAPLNPVDYSRRADRRGHLPAPECQQKESWRLAGEMMESVGIPAERYSDFPQSVFGE